MSKQKSIRATLTLWKKRDDLFVAFSILSVNPAHGRTHFISLTLNSGFDKRVFHNQLIDTYRFSFLDAMRGMFDE